MKLTKFEHSCFTVEKDGKSVVVDLGDLTDDFSVPPNVTAIISTHEHHDHLDPDKISKVVALNPNAIVYGPANAVNQLEGSASVQSVKPGDRIENGPFVFEFFGGQHQKPFEDSPFVENVSVLINNSVYHAGDSFATPNKPVDTLLLPVSGSWMKASMALELLFRIKPRVAIPTHDGILSDKGKKQVDRYWPIYAEKIKANYQRISEPIEVTVKD